MLELLNPVNALDTISGFLETGGPVVVALLFSTLLLWVLICERFLYFGLTGPRFRKGQISRWQALDDHGGWESHIFRDRLISEVRVANEQNMGVIKALVMITPLLGLLGTVTGMIEVFQIITDTGSSNARLMAAGISKATIPTMTGLAVSLTGVFSLSFLERRNERSVAGLSEQLEVDAGAGFGGAHRLTSSDMDEAEVNITPLLDIVFILLIFFIVTSTFLDEQGLEIVTPQDNPPDELTRPPPTLVLSVRNDGFVMVDNVRMIDPRSVKPVVEAFKAENPRGVVLLNAAPDAEVETTVLVLDQARMAGEDPALAIQSGP
ncbi:MAG: MotA/TolQ/ExbB proton channel family protein [Wenzhouxiangellaceae bacterium]|nr:MotA/TolQ/ExbB proton channel family protein [Wenzhouxiangellaceae bacterium]